jgi:hypothetical protein
MKFETTLFEYLECQKLQYITDIINNIKYTIDTNIIRGSDRNIHVLHRQIFTYHYTFEEYKAIFIRRAKRFLDIIKESNELLFVRININGHTTTEEEINKFSEAIHSINPSLNIKFLLINTIDDSNNYKQLEDSKIYNTTLIQKEFLSKDCPDVYLKNNKIIQPQFLNYLQECGVNINLKSNNKFNDKE